MTESTIATCQYSGCGKPIEQKGGRGHRPKVFCSDRCRQRHHREEEERLRILAIAAREAEATARIEALERENKELQERLNIEERFRTDTQAYDFRRWIRRYAQWRDIDFFKRFLEDTRLHVKPGTTRLMSEVPRSLYLARLKLYKYSEEDILLFEEAWKDMLFQS